MGEPGSDDRVARLLADLADDAARHIRPAGVLSAAHTVRRRRRIRTVAAAVATMLAVGPTAWYLSDRPTESGGDPSPGSTGRAGDPASVWAEFVSCARAHGHPDWPEPILDAGGAATFPGPFDVKRAFETVRATCGPILDQLPPKARPRAW